MIERVITLGDQPQDFDTGIAAPEISVTFRIFWDGLGFDLDWEPISYSIEFGGTAHEFHDFTTPIGQNMREWCATYWAANRDTHENEDETFDDYRDFHFHQHREDISIFHQSVL